MPSTLKNITTHVHTLAAEIGERNVFHPRALASAASYTHSQAYPPLLKWFYPDRGNFIAFVSNFRSRKVMHQAVHHFRQCTDFPLQHIATVPWVWSDHLAFGAMAIVPSWSLIPPSIVTPFITAQTIRQTKYTPRLLQG